MNGASLKLRAEADQKGVTSVRLLVNHPMLPERADPMTGETLPPHYVEKIIVALNGETVLVIDCGPGAAANPFFSFSLAGVKHGDTIMARWTDNQQQYDQLQTDVA